MTKEIFFNSSTNFMIFKVTIFFNGLTHSHEGLRDHMTPKWLPFYLLHHTGFDLVGHININ